MNRERPMLGLSFAQKKEEKNTKRLDESSRYVRQNKVALMINSATLVASIQQGEYVYAEDVENFAPVGILLHCKKNDGIVLDFDDPHKVKIVDVKLLEESYVYQTQRDTHMYLNNRNRLRARRSFQVKNQYTGEFSRFYIEIYLAEMLALGYLGFQLKTVGRTPEIVEQQRAIEQWVEDRKLIIISRNTEPFSLYGLHIAKRKEE